MRSPPASGCSHAICALSSLSTKPAIKRSARKSNRCDYFSTNCCRIRVRRSKSTPHNSSDMHDQDSTDTMFMSNAAGLARILAQDQPETALWEPEEMRAMWQHQLRAAMEADLSTLPSAKSNALRNAPEAIAFGQKSFGELLLHSQPPLVLLQLTKDFAK